MSDSTGADAVGGAIYGLGILGALVYFWQQADGFWGHVWSVLQDLLWPAFMVHEGFAALGAYSTPRAERIPWIPHGHATSPAVCSPAGAHGHGVGPCSHPTPHRCCA